MARGTRERGDPAHESAADADDVQVHQVATGNSRWAMARPAIAQVTAIANPVTRPVSSAHFTM